MSRRSCFYVFGKGADVNIKSISLLGHEGTLQWKQTSHGLQVTLPDKQPCEFAFSLKITSND